MGVIYGIGSKVEIPFITYQRFKNYFDKLKEQDPLLFIDLISKIKYADDLITIEFCHGDVIHITCNNNFSFQIHIPSIIHGVFCEFDHWHQNGNISQDLQSWDCSFIKTLLRINFFQVKLIDYKDNYTKVDKFKIVAKVPDFKLTMTKGLIGYIKNGEAVCFPIRHDAQPTNLGQQFMDLVEDEINHHYFIENFKIFMGIDDDPNILHESEDLSTLHKSFTFYEWIYLYDIDNKEIVFGKGNYTDDSSSNKQYLYSRITVSECIKLRFIAALIFNFEPTNKNFLEE